MTGDNGTMASPNYPCGYGGNQYCHWTIRPNGPISGIWITFDDFGLSFDHQYSSCRWVTEDFLGRILY